MTDNSEPATTPLYVDCDTGIDDALALAYLITNPALDLVGIGTVFGNTDAARAARNTLALLELSDRSEIPVAVGSAHPLTGPFPGGAPEVHGKDGVGGVALSPESARVTDFDAVEMLARLVEAHRGHLRVLALGPLTNLAHFAQTHPDLVGGIAEVVVMGGAFDHRGNASPTAEANIWHDPEAADRVFSAPWPLTLLPLDITMRHLLKEDETEQIRAIRGEVPARLADMLGTYLDAYEEALGVRHCALHDPLAAMVVDRGVKVVSEDATGMAVILDGTERGRTMRVDTDANRPRYRLVLDVDARAADVLLTRLRPHPWPQRPILPST